MSHFEWVSTGYTNEKEKIVETLLPLIEEMPSRKRWLDIGPGNGEITRAILSAFDSTVVVEPYPADLTLPMGVDLIPKKWEEIPGNDFKDAFDLVLCSHTLYYMDKKTVEEQVNKMYRCLSPNGLLVLILNAKNTLLAEYQEYIYPAIKEPIVKWIYSTDFARGLYKNYRYVTTATIEASIVAPDTDKFVELLYSISGAGHEKDREKLINLTRIFVEATKLGWNQDTSRYIFPLKSDVYIVKKEIAEHKNGM